MTTSPVMTVTDELLAELEQQSVRDPGGAFPVRYAVISELAAELRRLRAENAELAKDAGRYRWIAKRTTYGIDCRQRPSLTLPIYAPDHIDSLGYSIDTAMQSAQ